MVGLTMTTKVHAQLDYIVDIMRSDRSEDRKEVLIDSAFFVLHRRVSHLVWVMTIAEDCDVKLDIKW